MNRLKLKIPTRHQTKGPNPATGKPSPKATVEPKVRFAEHTKVRIFSATAPVGREVPPPPRARGQHAGASLAPNDSLQEKRPSSPFAAAEPTNSRVRAGGQRITKLRRPTQAKGPGAAGTVSKPPRARSQFATTTLDPRIENAESIDDLLKVMDDDAVNRILEKLANAETPADIEKILGRSERGSRPTAELNALQLIADSQSMDELFENIDKQLRANTLLGRPAAEERNFDGVARVRPPASKILDPNRSQ